MENQASSLATLRVALGYFFVGEAPKSLTFLSFKSICPGFVGVEARGLSSFVALTFQDRTIFPRARRMVAAIFCSSITARTFSGNGRRASACRRCSFAANILAISALTASKASISLQACAALGYRQAGSYRAAPVRAKSARARDPCCVRFGGQLRRDIRFATRAQEHPHR